MKIDEHYTDRDHENRSNDTYALLKYRLTLTWLERFGKNPREGELRLLNIGCGAGDFNVLAEQAGYLVDGIEPNPRALSLARQKSRAQSRLESISIFDFESTVKYDVVVMHDVLEHIEDDDGAMRKIRSIMAHGEDSVLVLSVPAHSALFGIHDEQIGHFRRYNKRSVRAVVSPYFNIHRTRYIALLGIPAALYYSRWRRIPYPMDKPGLGRTIFDLFCRLEEKVHFGIGSSLMLLCTPNATYENR